MYGWCRLVVSVWPVWIGGFVGLRQEEALRAQLLRGYNRRGDGLLNLNDVLRLHAKNDAEAVARERDFYRQQAEIITNPSPLLHQL